MFHDNQSLFRSVVRVGAVFNKLCGPLRIVVVCQTQWEELIKKSVQEVFHFTITLICKLREDVTYVTFD